MPLTKSPNEKIIYDRLKASGLNTAAICGILANIEAESAFNPKNLQNTYESKYGTDDEYTELVDKYNSSYIYSPNLIAKTKDSAGYGLCQWTYHTRKKALFEYAKSRSTSVSDLDMQIDFILFELQGKTSYKDFKSLWEMIKSATDDNRGASYIGEEFCKIYEKPKEWEKSAPIRASRAVEFRSYYSRDDTGVSNLGTTIVKIARDTMKSNTDFVGIDGASLIYYSYNKAGVSIPEKSTSSYYSDYKDSARVVDISDISAGDLIFYTGKSNSIAIGTGEGTRIYYDKNEKKTKEDKNLSGITVILRILGTNDTSKSVSAGDSEDTGLGGGAASPDYIDYVNRSVEDPYASLVSQYLTDIETEGFDYGYLIDLDHKEDFKFYIPEFTEQAGANWSDIELKGRSVTVKAYTSTNSRSVTISLDLYAGEGFYKATPGESGLSTVDRLHKDIYFVKSLEYPDYSNVITRPPATVLLVLGESFELTGVVSGVTVEHLKPLDSKNRSMYVKLSFTVTQSTTNPPDYRDIRKGKHVLTEQIGMIDYELGETPTVNTVIPESRDHNLLGEEKQVHTPW